MKRSLLLLLALLLAPSALPAQTLSVPSRDLFPEWALTIRINEAHAAFTTCGTRPITWTSNEVLDVDTAMVRAHEDEHRAHMSEFPSCREWYIWREASRENAIETEARAFCAGARTDFKRGRHPSMFEAIRVNSSILTRYWFSLSATEAFLAISRVCPDP